MVDWGIEWEVEGGSRDVELSECSPGTLRAERGLLTFDIGWWLSSGHAVISGGYYGRSPTDFPQMGTWMVLSELTKLIILPF